MEVDEEQPAPAVASGDRSARFGSAAVGRMGGRCFDIDVDIVDEAGPQILAELNSAAEADRACDQALVQLQGKLAFVSKSIARLYYRCVFVDLQK
jgi:hypothetical protein